MKDANREAPLKLIPTKLNSKEKPLEDEEKDYISIEKCEDTIQAGSRRIFHEEMDGMEHFQSGYFVFF